METHYAQYNEHPLLVVREREYSYQVEEFQVINTLGFLKAVMKQYIITGPDGEVFYLYKTTQNSWYVLDEAKQTTDPGLLWLMKIQIDKNERPEV